MSADEWPQEPAEPLTLTPLQAQGVTLALRLALSDIKEKGHADWCGALGLGCSCGYGWAFSVTRTALMQMRAWKDEDEQ